MGELAAQGDLPGIALVSETERHLRVAKAWRDAGMPEAGPGLISQVDRLFRDMRAWGGSLKSSEGHFSRAYEKYHGDLNKANRADRGRLLTLLTISLKENRGPVSWLKAAQPLVVFDGFHLFQPIELEFIAEVAKLTSVTLWLAGNSDTTYGTAISDTVQIFKDKIPQATVTTLPTPAESLARVGRSLFLGAEEALVPPAADLQILQVKTRREEVELICARVKERYRQGNCRLSDMAVVIHGSTYNALIREIFPRAGIPFNLAGGAFSLLQSRPVRVLHSALHLVQAQWRREELEQFLHQPLVLESIPRAYFLKAFLKAPCAAPQSLDDWQKAWHAFLESSTKHDSPQKPKKQEFLKALIEKLSLVKTLEETLEKACLKETIACLGNLLHALGISGWISGLRNLKEQVIPWVEMEKDQHAWTRLTSILEDLAGQSADLLPPALFLGAPRDKSRAFLSLLDQVLQGRDFQIKADDEAGVQILGAKEIRGMDFSCVFAPGLVEGSVPAPAEEGAVGRFRRGSPALREQKKRLDLEQEWLFTQLFESAREQLVLLFPAQDEDQQQVPSHFLAPFKITPAPPSHTLITQENLAISLGKCQAMRIAPPKKWPATAINLEEIRHWHLAPKALSSELFLNSPLLAIHHELFQEEFSPTQMEHYSACPFRYFARHVLKIETFEDTTAMVYGSFVHQVFSAYYLDKRTQLALPAEQPLPPISPEDRAGLAKTARKEWPRFKAESPLLGDHLLNLFLFPMGKLDQALEMLPKVEKDFGFLMGEKKIERVSLGKDSQGRKVFLSGKTDRVDASRTNSTKLAILDYKTGQRDKKKIEEKLQDGRLLQLPLYAFLLKSALPTSEVALGRYFFLGNKESKKDAGEYTVEVTGAARDAAVKKALENASSIRQGLFPLTTVSLSARSPECTHYCDFKDACRNPAGFIHSDW